MSAINIDVGKLRKQLLYSLMIVVPLLAAGCTTPTLMMEVPKPPSAAFPTLDKEGMFTRSESSYATFAFAKAISSIKYSATVAHWPSRNKSTLGIPRCNGWLIRPEQRVVWDRERMEELGDWNTYLGKMFYDTMKLMNYPVKGDPSELFVGSKKHKTADYQVGVDIQEIRGNLCEHYAIDFFAPRDLFPGGWISTGTYGGELYLKANWMVYSPLTEKIIDTVVVESYVKELDRFNNGFIELFRRAYEQNVTNLGAKESFKKVLLTKSKSQFTPISEAAIVFAKIPLDKGLVTTAPDRVLNGTVLIKTSSGHGSGFIVSEEGHILTNNHVVGASKTVQIVFNNGVELEGEVVRNHVNRDVALIKAPIRSANALPLRLDPPVKKLEQVFSIGAPLDRERQNTITKGMMNKTYIDKVKAMTFHQVDISINPGNSGGPLVDELGNVVAIAVRGIPNTRINDFIPITEALRFLKIELKEEE
ncbi:MAG: trypsin-like peptidase domain-containing protein [Magnetococcales bacterium]|nr:trypsin-like peptidase domain-containing protein [Magnetococcales bacterium]